MNVFFIAAALSSIFVGLCLLAPIIRRRDRRKGGEAELAVYRDQLREIDRDLERGVIDETAAAGARHEIERRILRASRYWRDREGTSLKQSGWANVIAVALALIVLPAGTVAIYLQIGSPDQPDLPLASREAPQNEVAPQIEAMVARLEERLENEPDDLEGWRRLARSKRVLGRMDESVAALRRALELAPDDMELQSQLGEGIVATSGGIITPEAIALFEAVQQTAPFEPRSGYFLGLAEAQAGNFDAAVAQWRNLLAHTPSEASWREPLYQAIVDAGAQMEFDVSSLAEFAPDNEAASGAASAPVPPTGLEDIDPETLARFQSMSAEERLAQIESMVEGLQQRLEDEDGNALEWQRLGRALSVLDRVEESRAAFATAVDKAPDDALILRDYAISLMGARDERTGLPIVGDEAVAQLEILRSMTPEDPEIYWFLGVNALQSEDRDAALAAWRRALEFTAPDHPDRETLERFVNELSG